VQDAEDVNEADEVEEPEKAEARGNGAAKGSASTKARIPGEIKWAAEVRKAGRRGPFDSPGAPLAGSHLRPNRARNRSLRTAIINGLTEARGNGAAKGSASTEARIPGEIKWATDVRKAGRTGPFDSPGAPLAGSHLRPNPVRHRSLRAAILSSPLTGSARAGSPDTAKGDVSAARGNSLCAPRVRRFLCAHSLILSVE
jgi:hypothetical protein